MTRRRGAPLVAGNWKMNTAVPDGVALAREVARGCTEHHGVEVAVIPPFTHLWPVRDALGAGVVLLGAQDVFWADWGAFTGEVSPAMLAGWCDLVLVGHSERRHLLGESDEDVGKKVAAAARHGLRVMVAVGETEAERDAGEALAVVDRQLAAALAPLAGATIAADAWSIAYEPVWAIGTGRSATAEQAEEMCHHIVQWVEGRGGAAPRVLYGGSVTPRNAAELFAQPHIDGALVGGASLVPHDFLAIVGAASKAD